jgi:hypothetical protein
LYRLAAASIAGTTLSFVDEEIVLAPNAFAISNPRAISASEDVAGRL